jgi:3-oxoacyl-[acyl-carrier protein] reductase
VRRFDGVGVIVTGSSRGLGRALAVAFAREGAHVGVTYRSQSEAAEETLCLLRDAGGSGEIHRVDVRDASSVRSAFTAFVKGHAIDVLVNNAAVVRDQPFMLLSREDWSDTLATNLTGTYHACRAALQHMMVRRRGAIVNVASVAGLRASPQQSAYGASKAGVLSLTRTLAHEVAPHGIRVNAIVPGLLDTGMGARLDHRRLEHHLAGIPAGRLGTGDEVARAALFLASDDASYVVGQALAVDGGLG